MDQPQASSRPARKIYYGWVIVAVIIIANTAQAGGTLAVTGIFLKPITEEFGWSRAVFSGATGVGTILGAALALAAGPVVDRWGARWPLVIGFLILGGTFIRLGSMSGLGEFYFLQVAGRAAHMGVLSVGLMSTIPKWFIASRGKAVALGTVGNAVGIVGFPVVAQVLITAFDWRVAAQSLGVALLAIALPPILLFLRRRPEDMGMAPDGRPLITAATPGEMNMEERRAGGEGSMRIGQVSRHSSFYLLTFASTVGFMGVTATFFHMVPYLTDKGFAPGAAVSVVATWSAGAGVGSVVTGFFLDRFDARVMIALQLWAAAALYALLTPLGILPTLIVWAVVYGFVQGGMITTQQVLFANYYGRRHLGSIRGVVMLAMALGNAAGATGSALVFDVTDSYISVFWAFAVLNGAGAAAAMVARKPKQMLAPASGAAPSR